MNAWSHRLYAYHRRAFPGAEQPTHSPLEIFRLAANLNERGLLIQRRAVAKFIIRLAQEDDSLDAATLRDRAVADWEVSPTAPSRRRSAPCNLPERRVTAERRAFHQDVASAIEVADERERL
jgi:hypothetical protein